MSTQEDSGISIAYQHNQQGYRLLELPPDILESLGTGHTATLKIKSNLPSAKNTGDSSSSSHAVLCTERQTFHLRQVQSSNSILLLKPTQAPSTTDKPALSIIACPKSTLELHPASTSVISYLERVLAKYYGPQDASEGFEPMDVSSDTFSRKQTKRRVFDDVPASEHECQQAWTALCVFEREGVAYRPAASALIGVWKVMHTTAAAEGIDLSGRFDLVILWERMEDDGYPKALVEAVLARLSSENATSNSGWPLLQAKSNDDRVSGQRNDDRHDGNQLDNSIQRRRLIYWPKVA
ncbi:MAG: hypothetical protein M1816_005478 [Peltula sp. TS41687]|nr:MAG: hypothetical protein M1816_005478 [Peltula sp. TS41687]